MTSGLKSACLPFLLLLFAVAQSRDSADAPRGSADPGTAPNETYRIFKWNRGDPPIKMIRADEGFCFLSGVGGSFAGGAERVRVYIRDGYWYLEGMCMQSSLWAEATSVRHGDRGERKRCRSRRQSWRSAGAAGTLGP